MTIASRMGKRNERRINMVVEGWDLCHGCVGRAEVGQYGARRD